MAGADAEKEMSFWDHLDVLRGSLFRALGAICLCAVLGFAFKEFLFDRIVLAPSRGDFCIYRLLGWDFSMQLINV